jgi:hypothetical protein
MSASFYVLSYRNAIRRLFGELSDLEPPEWLEERTKINEALRWSVAGMLTQADSNDPEIWHALGDALQGGHGIARDAEQAETLFMKAANAGYAPAMVRLGNLCRRDATTPEQLANAAQWYQRAADLGHASGMTNLGFVYRDGHGVDADPRIAADWFIKAYHAGDKYAAYRAGSALSYRRENHLEAVEWLTRSADDGDSMSQYSLALIYEDRNSPAHDPEKAYCCWLQVAQRPQGTLRFDAMHTLARCCRDGIGVKRDLQQAKEWLDRLIAVAPKDKSDYRHAVKLRKEMDEELL